MILSIIVVADERNAIGKNNSLLCHLPADLKHFKIITSGHTVIMGRKTFESLPNGSLPKRRNIVLTRNTNLSIQGCEICSSLCEAVELCKNEEEVFIIGGGTIYKEAMEMADVIYLTRVHREFEGADTFFPAIDATRWKGVSCENHNADEKNPYDYSFIRYEKINR